MIPLGRCHTFIIVTKEVAIMADNDSPIPPTDTLSSNSKIQPSKATLSTQSNHISELIHQDQSLYTRICHLNQDGITQFELESYEQALVYFQQCQTLSQQLSASSSNSNLNLIIALNNQAVIYQKTNRADKAAILLQKTVNKFQGELQGADCRQLKAKMKDFSLKRIAPAIVSGYMIGNAQKLKRLFTNQWELACYYLRYSGLLSQIQKHEESLNNAKKSLTALKQLCKLCYQYCSIVPVFRVYGKVILNQLSCLDQKYQGGLQDLQNLREEFSHLVSTPMDNNQIFHQSFDVLSAQDRKRIEDTDIHMIFDLQLKKMNEMDQKEQPSSIDICQSYQNHMKKILFIMGAYFAISVQIQQLQSIRNQISVSSAVSYTQMSNRQTVSPELVFLSSLTVGFKYIPVKTALMVYLQEYYKDNYLIRTPEESRVNQYEHIEVKEKSQQQIRQDKEEVEHNEEMAKNIDILQEKYKQYLIDRDVSMEIDEEESCCIVQKQAKQQEQWEQLEPQMKTSKKLQQLLKSQTLQPPKVQSKYLNDVASIDSFEMNSHSIIQPSLSHHKSESQIIFKGKKKKNKKHIKETKQITECESYREDGFSAKNTFQADVLRAKSKQVKNARPKKSSSRSNRKSKSANNIKSKSKDPASKGISKKRVTLAHIPIHDVPSEKSLKKRKNKKSPSKTKTTGLSGIEQAKLIVSDKRVKMGNSEQMKLQRVFSPMSSLKDQGCSLKFNKVKSPLKMGKQPVQLRMIERHKHLQWMTTQPDKPAKTVNKNKSTSQGTKKQFSKPKSLSTKKTLQKKLKSQSKPLVKIYTQTNIKMKKR